MSINQAVGQADPTNVSPVTFSVVFSESVSDFTGADVTVGGTSTHGVASVTGSGTNYTVTVPVSANGTVVASVAAGTAHDAVGNANTASTSSDDTVTYATASPLTATVNQAAGQADPTNVSPVSFTVVFSSSVSDFTGADVTVGGTATHGAASVTGSGTTYTVTVPVTSSGTVTASLAAGVAHDAFATPNTASTSTDNSVTFDNVGPSVTVNQAAGQADPTSTSPVSFTVVFSESVSDFTAADVTVGGTATHGAASVTGSGTTYTVSVPVSSAGTVTASLAAGVAHDAVGNASSASTSTDNSVTFTVAAPLTVTVNQAVGQADPTATSPVSFTVVFSSTVSDFTSADVTVGGTATHGVASVTGSGTTYTVTVPVTTSGTVTASLAANVAHSGAAGNAASTSTDNSVTFDNVRPSVTVNQAAGQADPTSTSPVSFTVVFSESVSDFTAADVTVGGTATHGAASVTGSGTTYTVSVPVSSNGTVTASLAQNVAHDAAGNGSTASTSTDNSVTFASAAALSVTSVNPASRGQGAANQTVVITGTGFGGANGTFGGTVAFSGTGITVNSVTKNSATQLTANISLSTTATTGARNVTVTNPAPVASATCNGCFTVAARPTVTSLNPSSRGRGATNQFVTVTGTNFQAGATVAFSGSGITVNSVAFNSASSLTVNLNISGSATLGARDVTVTNPDAGTFTLNNGFTVNSGPGVTTLSPASLPQGATNAIVFVNGSNFTIGGGSSVFSGTGITFNWAWRMTTTQMMVSLNVDPGGGDRAA